MRADRAFTSSAHTSKEYLMPPLQGPVVTVLSSVAPHHLEAAVVSLDWEVDLEDVGAGLDDVEDAVGFLDFFISRGPRVSHVFVHQVVLHQDAGLVEEVLDHLEEAWALCLGDVDEPVGDDSGAGGGGGGVEVGAAGQGFGSLLQKPRGLLAGTEYFH